MKKAVIFDFDGVIIDSKQSMISYNQKRFHDYSLVDLQNTGHNQSFFTGSKMFNERKRDLSEEEKLKYHNDFVLEKAESKLFDGILDLLSRLKEKYFLFINTSAKEETSEALILKYNLRSLFDKIYRKEDSLDKAEKFQMIMDEYSFLKEDIVFVTDTTGDVLEAHNLEIATIAVTWGFHPVEFFKSQHYPNLVAIVDNTAQLESAINEFFQG